MDIADQLHCCERRKRVPCLPSALAILILLGSCAFWWVPRVRTFLGARNQQQEASVEDHAHEPGDEMNDEPPIFVAVQNENLKRVRQLVSENPEVVHERYPGLGNQPLHYAGTVPIAAFLLDHGAQVDAKGAHGMTALHYAARYGHVQVAKLLLDRGANIDAEDDGRFTPIFTASRGREPGCTEVAQLLEHRGAKVGLNDFICLGQLEKVRMVLDTDPKACATAKFPGYLIEDMVTLIDCRIMEGTGPNEDPRVAKRVIAEALPVLAKMLDQGADPDGGFRTAMCYAVQFPTSDVARLLLERGASLTQPRST
jgi:ankyrin repeat protein